MYMDPMTNSEVLGVGIIGCGQATQALHIPALNSLARHFEVVCVCDVDEAVASSVGRRLGAKGTTLPSELLAEPSVDVVLIASPDAFHVDHALEACAAAPRAVLLEKPVAMSSRHAKEVAAASKATGVPIIVNYPHVYDPVFARALSAWGTGQPPISGEVEILMSRAGTYTADEILETIAANPPPERWPGFSMMNYALQTTELLGTRIGVELVYAHMLLVGILIHELPVLRRLIGEPERVEYAALRPTKGVTNPLAFGIDLMLAVGGGSVFVRFELQSMRMNDWGYRFRRDGLAIAVHYPFPYASQAPATLAVRREDDGMNVDEVFSGRYETGVRRAWKHVHDVSFGRAEVQTSAADAVRDVELVEEILRAMQVREVA